MRKISVDIPIFLQCSLEGTRQNAYFRHARHVEFGGVSCSSRQMCVYGIRQVTDVRSASAKL